MYPRLLAVCIAAVVAAGCAKRNDGAADNGQSAEAVEALIWEKELAIFAGRGEGDISNYIGVASDHYLGWPPVLPRPTTLETLKATADQAVALRGEVSNLSRKGFTLNGDTAIMYFLNHRTRLGDGMADEGQRAVSQFYENVHVWNKEGGEWKLIGGFARTVDAPRN
ncbi:MAG: hypothetical protein AAFX58_00435 [Pseudomonadota bacterium]